MIKQNLPPPPACAYCDEKRPAVCWGRYESMTEHHYACGECCGHGCEDGHCDMLDDGFCVKREDETHCVHWWDGDEPCCSCGHGAASVSVP